MAALSNAIRQVDEWCLRGVACICSIQNGNEFSGEDLASWAAFVGEVLTGTENILCAYLPGADRRIVMRYPRWNVYMLCYTARALALCIVRYLSGLDSFMSLDERTETENELRTYPGILFSCVSPPVTGLTYNDAHVLAVALADKTCDLRRDCVRPQIFKHVRLYALLLEYCIAPFFCAYATDAVADIPSLRMLAPEVQAKLVEVDLHGSESAWVPGQRLLNTLTETMCQVYRINSLMNNITLHEDENLFATPEVDEWWRMELASQEFERQNIELYANLWLKRPMDTPMYAFKNPETTKFRPDSVVLDRRKSDALGDLPKDILADVIGNTRSVLTANHLFHRAKGNWTAVFLVAAADLPGYMSTVRLEKIPVISYIRGHHAVIWFDLANTLNMALFKSFGKAFYHWCACTHFIPAHSRYVKEELVPTYADLVQKKINTYAAQRQQTTGSGSARAAAGAADMDM